MIIHYDLDMTLMNPWVTTMRSHFKLILICVRERVTRAGWVISKSRDLCQENCGEDILPQRICLTAPA
jgi:hypothetical protein